jgi:hypothetical protein
MKTSTSTAVAALSLLASSALAARTVEPLLKRATPTPSNYTFVPFLPPLTLLLRPSLSLPLTSSSLSPHLFPVCPVSIDGS